MPRLFQVTYSYRPRYYLASWRTIQSCELQSLVQTTDLVTSSFCFLSQIAIESKLTNPFSFKLSMVSLMLVSSGINSMPKLLILSFDTWYVGTNGLSSAHLQRSALSFYLFCRQIVQVAVC